MGERREVALLLRLLDEAYDAPKPWHGSNLRRSIGGMTQATAAWRPGRGRHSIWEIAVHCAYWKYAVRRRLTGEKRGSFPLPGSNWFSRPATALERTWSQDVALLEEEHRRLRATVASLEDQALKKRLPGGRYSNFRLIMGIAAHDLYHAGQIRLVKRLSSRRR